MSDLRRAFSVAVYARRADTVLVIEHRRLKTWLPIGGELEAAAAAESFRDVADADRDGRVSLREYGAALEFIRARY